MPDLRRELLRTTFRQHAAGVAVVTAYEERPVGFTSTSLTSVALDPPLISFGVSRSSSSWPAIARTSHVAVHILADDQQELAARFATSGADRFGVGTGWRRGPEGVPVLDGVLGWLVCRIRERVPAGDHRLVIAEVITGSGRTGEPLLYHNGRYRPWPQSSRCRRSCCAA
ncbi:flavin reductase family protein [Actinoplanes solisilvae]|uniref:flavin reductase family protein n=1 Tax=Actinoplanes solisilvae TaxID=2486853 RepID=UPI000FDCB743|nr:flavin reductase family protein [Actinoplanes solisilvae]